MKKDEYKVFCFKCKDVSDSEEYCKEPGCMQYSEGSDIECCWVDSKKKRSDSYKDNKSKKASSANEESDSSEKKRKKKEPLKDKEGNIIQYYSWPRFCMP